MKPQHAGEDQTPVTFDLSYTMPELEAISTLNYYPDPQYRKLKEKIARFRHVQPDQVVVAGGSSALIHAIARARYLWAPPERRLSISRWATAPRPSYLEYQYACEKWGFRFHYGPRHDLLAHYFNWVRESAAEIAWVCNPHNPTGYFGEITPELLSQVGQNTLLVADEAYLFQAGRLESSVSRYLDVLPNVIVLGTLSKDFGMPGARVGYALFGRESEFQVPVQDQIEPWSISGVSDSYARSRLEYLETARELNREAVVRAEFLRRSCAGIGYKTIESSTAFFLLELPEDWQKVLEAQYSIRVRRCTDYGFPDFVRVVARSEESDQALLSALREMYASMPKLQTEKAES